MPSPFQIDIGPRRLSFETGKLAQQANGSLLLRYGDCLVLAAVTMGRPREGTDFLPLTVDFEERLYARGKIPGSFFRREGRPSSDAILVDRLTDRPLRPLFPKGLRNEIQVVVTPFSADLENPLDVLAVTGASAALCISDIPFDGPVAATRVGYVDGALVVNPTYQELERSKLDLVVAGSRRGVIMMEAGASELSEDAVLEAIQLAQDVNLRLVELQERMAREVGKPKARVVIANHGDHLEERVGEVVRDRIAAALADTANKSRRKEALDSLQAQVMEALSAEADGAQVAKAFDALVEREVRRRILHDHRRPDGRGLKEIRPISSEVGLLPRTHGSALFSRGETQVLGIATLGSVGDAQKLDNLSPQEYKRFLLHYNFPPYSTGEARRLGGPGRREIGHGALAERALAPVLPTEEEFPYTIRVVAEVLSSNGSTSMASVCAASLALMDAGVPIRRPVAGISIGLVTGVDGEFVTLADIQGMEDYMGDMDFKVAGTSEGITAIQLDLKVSSIGPEVVRAALLEARDVRHFLLSRMSETIGQARPDVSQYAPKMVKINIPVEKIGMLIGPGGRTIRAIVEETKATIDVQDDGTVVVGAANPASAQAALDIIRRLTKEVRVGEIYTGKVVRIMNFGAFVELLPGKDGMVHISELADHHVERVEEEVELGEEITVLVTQIDTMGRVNLSRKALLQGAEGQDGSNGAATPVTATPPSGPGAPPRETRPGGYQPSRPGGTGGRPPQSRGPGGGPGGGHRRRPSGPPRGPR